MKDKEAKHVDLYEVALIKTLKVKTVSSDALFAEVKIEDFKV